MTRRTKTIWVILALLAMGVFIASWPLYKKFTIKQASAGLVERTRSAVDKNPNLRADWDQAMADGTLTWEEAKAILEKIGEKVDPEN